MEVYIIKQIWVDWLENRSENAVGYDIIGYVTSKQAAEEFCDKGRDYDVNDCWAVKGTMPQYTYTLLKELT